MGYAIFHDFDKGLTSKLYNKNYEHVFSIYFNW